MRLLTAVAISICLPYVEPAFAQNDTRAALNAREVKELVHVSLGRDATATVIKAALDDDKTPETAAGGRVYVARKAISVVYRDPNPLSLSLSAGIEEADDPSNAALVKIIEALAGIPPIVAAGPAGAAARTRSQTRTEMFRGYGLAETDSKCQPAVEAYGLLNHLRDNLYPDTASAAGLGGNLDLWKKTLDAAASSTGVGVRRQILEEEDGIIALVKDEAADLKENIDAATMDADTLDAQFVKVPGTDACAQLTRAVYSLAAMTQPRRRIGELQKIKQTLDALAAALADFAAESRWLPADQHLYVITPVHATPEKLQQVTVRATELTYSVPDETSGILVVRGTTTSGTFVIRRFDKWVTEIGAGLISAEIATPRYGTEEREGQTFAARVGEDKWSWSPAVVGNFVCRCWQSDKVAFMVQVGAVPSKDTPALLGGIGTRLFGGTKGGVGISAGFVHAWVKELPDEFLTKPISGTKDIEANIRFVEHWKPYLMIQYQF